MSDERKRGRPPIHSNDEERRLARLAAKKRSAEKSKNITVDADLVELLNSVADDLEEDFGFRPSLSQTLRWLIRSTKKVTTS